MKGMVLSTLEIAGHHGRGAAQQALEPWNAHTFVSTARQAGSEGNVYPNLFFVHVLVKHSVLLAFSILAILVVP